MSRNFQRRSAAVAASKRNNNIDSSDNQTSSDDDYRGVDDISDDEESDPDVEKAEEQHFAEYGLEDNATPRPSQDDESSWQGCDDDNTNSLPDFFGDSMETMVENEWAATDNTIKSVRFVDCSDDSDLQSVNSDFPDILDKDSLSQSFRAQIDHDPEADIDSDESYWDHQGDDDEGQATEEVGQQESHTEYNAEDTNDSDSDESGYDSGGETTDDDIPEHVQVAGARQVMKTADDESSADEEVVRRKPAYPKLGKWTHSMKRPFAVLHTNGKKMVFFNKDALRRYGSVDNLSAASPRTQADLTPRAQAHVQESSPMMSNSATVMMSAFSSGDFMNELAGQVAGPMEAFYPWTSMNADGTFNLDNPFADNSSLEDFDLDEGEAQLALEDFLNLDGETSDEEKDEEAPEQSSDATAEPNSTPARPTPKADSMLDRFSTVNVSAFRRDQDRKQLINYGIETKDSLAFGGQHLEGTVRGLKQNRIQHANTPITPMRKRKISKAAPLASSPASPLSRAASNKRRFDGPQHNGHKRQRSLV